MSDGPICLACNGSGEVWRAEGESASITETCGTCGGRGWGSRIPRPAVSKKELARLNRLAIAAILPIKPKQRANS